MAKLAIKGHATRGKEVIELLEMLGGKNDRNYTGDLSNYVYTINEHGIIDWYLRYNSFQYVTFTLEEFLEKFPYKVGDKVSSKYLKNYKIEKMEWEDTNNRVIYKLQGMGWYSSDELQLYKEETMDKANKVVFDTNAQCCDIMNNLTKKETIEGKITINEDKGTLVAIDLTREIKKANEIEVILGDYEFVLKDGKTYFVKKNKYPKDYEECCGVLKIPNDERYIDIDVPLDYNKVLSAFTKLLICRDAYWKIAGEQMGLGKPWEPDWIDVEQDKYVLFTHDNASCSNRYVLGHNILAFPTAEMRDAFFENFKDLIESCKELL